MNEEFRKELDIQLSDVGWRTEDTEMVRKVMAVKRRPSARTTLVLAAALAVLLALAGIGYAEYDSGLLSRLFGERAVRQEAEELLVSDPVSVTKNGITAAITEYLYDGQTLHMSGEMRNDTDEALLCGMRPLEGGEGSGGVFDLTSHFVLIQPGETAAGWCEISGMGAQTRAVNVQAVALKPVGEVKPDVNDTEYYSKERHWNTELTETVYEETLSFQMVKNQTVRPSRSVPGEQKIRMEEQGYTLVVKKANFAAASSEVRFEIIPDDPKDIQSYGDEGADGHARLYRRYEILDEKGDRLFKGLTGGSGFGWDVRKTKLKYSFSYKPLQSVPENIILVPCGDDGSYLMDEAVIIPIIPLK